MLTDGFRLARIRCSRPRFDRPLTLRFTRCFLNLSVLLAFVLLSAEQSAAQECVIEIGGGGRTQTFRAEVRPGEQRAWPAVTPSDFIRKTSGPCAFAIYNSNNYAGRSVTLGSNLSQRIRAGIDGVSNKDGGGGETWKIRSLKIIRPRDIDCRLNIGGGGVRMDYFSSAVVVPAMDRVGSLYPGNCSAKIWNFIYFGRDDVYKRFKSLHPSGPRDGAYDPGFRVRSIELINHPSDCQAFTKDQGRCLPQHRLIGDIYAVSGANPDRDGDGLVDRFENDLAEAFRPIYVNDSGENATRVNVYTTETGESVIEPVTIYQVHPDAAAEEIVIVFMKLWRQDRNVGVPGLGGAFSPICGSHEGDSQAHSVHLKTTTGRERGRLWYVYRTGGGIPIDDDNTDPDLDWRQGEGSLRKPNFERWGHELGNKHLVIFFSRGKHHEYADGGWSGGFDKRCSTEKAYVNGMGQWHRPTYPKRVAIIKAPRRTLPAGEDYTNVGSRRVPFIDDLGPYGFPGQRVWSGEFFYSSGAHPINRRFK